MLVATILRIGLNIGAIELPETIEVVDIRATEIGCYQVVQFRERYSLLHCQLSIYLQHTLWSVGIELGGEARNLGHFAHHLFQRVTHLREILNTASASVLQHKSNAIRHAKSGDSGRLKGVEGATCDPFCKEHIYLVGNLACRKFALGVGGEFYEDDTRVCRGDTAQQVEACGRGLCHHTIDTLNHLPRIVNGCRGARGGGGIGGGGRYQEVALVLGGEKCRGECLHKSEDSHKAHHHHQHYPCGAAYGAGG